MASQTFIPDSFSFTIWKIYQKKPWTRGGSSFLPTASRDMFRVCVHGVPWSVTAWKQRFSSHLTGAAVTLTFWNPYASQSPAGSTVWVPPYLHTSTLTLSSKVLPSHHSSPEYPTRLWWAQGFITHWKGLCPHTASFLPCKSFRGKETQPPCFPSEPRKEEEKQGTPAPINISILCSARNNVSNKGTSRLQTPQGR